MSRRKWHLFGNQKHLRDEDVRGYADKLRLDGELFGKELGEHVHAARVHHDFMSGVQSGVQGTPTFYINGVRHDGADLEVLLTALEQAAIFEGETR